MDADGPVSSERSPVSCGNYERTQLRVRYVAWRDRLLWNTWRRPLPYLLHSWEIVTPAGYVTSGSKSAVGRWLAEWLEAELLDWAKRHADGGGYECACYPRIPAVPWVVHSDADRPQRCPCCSRTGGIAGQLEASGWQAPRRHIFECRETWDYPYGTQRSGCGQLFSARWYLRAYPGREYRDGYRARMGHRMQRVRNYVQWACRELKEGYLEARHERTRSCDPEIRRGGK